MDDKAVDATRRMDRLLARQLKYGIWLASSVTTLGMIVALFGRGIVPETMTLGTSIVGKGIALIILLPILRVVLMLMVFVRERDYLLGMISGIVLLTIGVSVVVGLYGPAIQ